MLGVLGGRVIVYIVGWVMGTGMNRIGLSSDILYHRSALANSYSL